jgi:D-arabinose 1-dehydrogenase-like Zn-dependent alcohol dehydrogenase
MRAAILHDGTKLDVGEVPDPVADGWALVSVRAAGVCGTELHFLDGMIPPPSAAFVLGHEIAGVVASVPPGSDLVPGERVAVYNFVGCGSCLWCRTGRESVCIAPLGQLGFTADGGFAELVRAPAENLIRIPDDISFEAAAVLCCSGMTAVHAARLAEVELGATAVVNGVGGVGLMVTQVLAASGVRAIAVADSADKADMARAAGARDALVLEGGAGYDELPNRVRELTGGAGADYYFELVGTEQTMRAGIRSLARRGTCVLIGYTADELRIHPIDLILSEARIVSSVAASRQDLDTALQLAADGLLTVTVDTRYPLEEVSTALGRLRAREVRGRNVLVF